MTQRRELRRTHTVSRAGMVLLTALLLLVCSASSARAQLTAADPGRGYLTRAELQQLLTNYNELAASGGYSGTIRAQAEREAALVQQRLTEGDLREGDRIQLVVEGHAQLSDTFNVVSGRRIVLPELGEVSLAGVLRSELQAHVHAFVSRFIRNPTVHARSLMRVEIRGAVTQPGFYTIPSDYVLSDALMMAGGPTADSELSKLRIARADDVIWDGTQLRDAVIAGRTLDQLSVRTGDLIELPKKKSSLSSVLEILGIVSTLTGVIMLVRGPGGG